MITTNHFLDMDGRQPLPSISQLDLPPRPPSAFSYTTYPRVESPRPPMQRSSQSTDTGKHAFAMHSAGLPTPPNSNPLPISHSFRDVGEDYGEHDALLFPRPSVSPRFSPRSPPRRIVTNQLPAPQPSFEELKPLGYKYDRMMLDRIDCHSNSPQVTAFFQRRGIQPPSPDDYHHALRFQRDLICAMSRRRLVERSQQEASPTLPAQPTARQPSPPVPRRKILQDATASRRAVSPLAQPAASYSAQESENQVPATQHRRRRSSTAGAVRRRAQPRPIAGGKEAKSARAKSTKAQKSDNFLDYPDFAPPHSAMHQAMDHAMKAKDYGNHPLDMTNDPCRKLMHSAEVELAQKLHLSGAKYLCVKRQLFEEFVKLLRNESDKQANWNKTAAQRVSNVDVTKTSVVWQFFNDIGWFDKSLFTELIDKSRDLSGEYYPRRASATAPTAA